MLFWIISFIPLSVITGALFNWRNQIAYGLVWAGLLGIWSGFKRYDFTFKAALSLLLFHVCYHTLLQESPYPSGDPNFLLTMDSLIQNSALCILISVIAIDRILEKHFFTFTTMLSSLVFCGSILMIVKPVFGLPRTAFLNSDSMDATLIAICYPTYCIGAAIIDGKIWKKTLFSLPVLAILLSRSSMGLLCLCVAIATSWHRVTFRNLIRFIIPVTLIIACVGILLMGHEAFNFNGRTAIWEASFDFWGKYVNHYSGAGLGTYDYFGPLIQRMYGIDYIKTRWIFMHSDWLQVLFELGSIGFGSAVAMAIISLSRARKNSTLLFSTMLTIFVASIANMPFHYFPSGFICLLFLMKTLREDSDGKTQMHH